MGGIKIFIPDHTGAASTRKPGGETVAFSYDPCETGKYIIQMARFPFHWDLAAIGPGDVSTWGG